MMSNRKIVFAGPFGAGKTTAIATLNDISFNSTIEISDNLKRERLSTESANGAAMDYGVLNLAGGERLYLYGANGVENLDYMWDFLIEECIGLVLLINNNAVNPFRDLHFFLAALDNYIEETPAVIGITCMDQEHYPTILDYHLQLEDTKYKLPIFEVDAREHLDIVLLVKALLYNKDPTTSTRLSGFRE